MEHHRVVLNEEVPFQSVEDALLEAAPVLLEPAEGELFLVPGWELCPVLRRLRVLGDVL